MSREQLTIAPGMQWESIKQQIKELTDKALKTEYLMYRDLQAKSANDTLLEALLENEYYLRKNLG